MNHLIVHSTSLAQWYTLVNEAEDLFGRHLDTELESYLVFLLQRYANKPDLVASILALDYLDSIETTGSRRAEKLRDVGDKCLLFSGFFPEIAPKRLVTVSYFVELGRRAYHYLAAINSQGVLTTELYSLLRQHFVHLLDLLLYIRELSGDKQSLTLLQASELWRNTRSQYALRVLKRYDPDNTKFLQVH
jgi:hypothetical protein